MYLWSTTLLHLSYRFGSKRNFDHDLKLPPPITNNQARDLHRQWLASESSDIFQQLWVGLCWIAEDLAQRLLGWNDDLPNHLGEELISHGCIKLKDRLRQLPPDVQNIKAWLSVRLAGDILEYTHGFALCSVPPSTNRSRVQKGLDPHKPPQIDLVDDDHTFDRCTERNPFHGWTLDDIYTLCNTRIERDIIRLRYHDGDGPRCGKEIAFILDIPYRKVMKRLDEIETQVYNAVDVRKPRRSRQKGKRFLHHKKTRRS